MTFRPPKKPALTLDATLVQDDLPLEVIPKVFIGSIHSAFNAESLHHNGVTHILNASRLPITFPKQFTYLSVEIRDRDTSNILACIPTTNIFIEAGLEHGGVLVHCFGGKSRSAAFVCAYIMSSLSWSFDEAYATLKAARPIVEINAGFECQLRAYHAASCDVYIAQQLLLRTRVRALHRTRQLNIQLLRNAAQNSANSGNNSNSGSMVVVGDSKAGGDDKRASPPTVVIGGTSTINYTPLQPNRGGVEGHEVEHSSSFDSMEVDEPATNTSASISNTTSTHATTHALQPINTTTTIAASQPHPLRDSHKYDSFTYGSASGFNKSDDSSMQRYGALHIPKLTTQSEDDAEYTFCKTRSISDVYTTGMDPCLEDNTDTNNTTAHTTTTHTHNSNATHDEDDPQTLKLLQQKHYIADSPSNAMHHTINTSNSMSGLSGFSALSTGGSNNGSANTGFRGLGLSLNISTNTNTSDTNSNATNTNSTGGGMGGIGLGLSLNTAPLSIPSITTINTNPSINTTVNTTSDTNNTTFTTAPVDYSHGLTSTANSSSANFMQGSGSLSGNRTHRASAQANRHKTGATANGGGSRGRKSRSSSSSDDAPPACRLSRPNNSVVRVIPPLRGLERQFLCSWCNTSLFTTANVLRTDLDLRVLLDVFVSSSGAALAAAAHNSDSTAQGQGRFRQGGEEAHLALLAQEKERSRLSNINNSGSGASDSSTSNSLTSSPYTIMDQQEAKSSAVSPAMRLHSHNNNHNNNNNNHNNHNNTLPAINPGSNASSPAHRLGEAKLSFTLGNNNNTGNSNELSPKKGEMSGMDVPKSNNSSSGRLPVITLNRSAQGSSSNLLHNTNNNTSINNTSSTNPHVLSRTSSGNFGNNTHNNNNNNNNSNSGMEMEVDSPPKQSYDQEDRYPQPRAPPGGPRTSRAMQARAFDFDLPIIDTSINTTTNAGTNNTTTTTVSPLKEAVMSSIAEYTHHHHTAYNSYASNISTTASTPTTPHHNMFSDSASNSRRYHQDDINLGTLSAEHDNDNNSNKGSSSRRGSGGGLGGVLPLLLHSKTTISSSSIGSDSGNSASSGTNPGNPYNHPVLMSTSTPTLSHTDLHGTTNTNTTSTSADTTSATTSALPQRMANLKVSLGLGIASLNTFEGAYGAHPSGPKEVHQSDYKHAQSPSGVNTARSEESPRIHIPPHRLQQYHNSLLLHHNNTATNTANNTTSTTNTSNALSDSPRAAHQHSHSHAQSPSPQHYAHLTAAQQQQLQVFARPQSAEKRRWLERMNLLRNSSSQALLLAQHHTSSGGFGNGGNGGGSSAGEYVGGPSTLGQSGDHKVMRLAEADVAASQIIYSGSEKYFHIEYLDWMGGAPLCAPDKGSPEKSSGGTSSGASGGTVSDSGDICCPSCKNAVGMWTWVPSAKSTLSGKLEAPIFKIHKHVVHQMDVVFDATPSSTPRISSQQMNVDA